jgi:hypothetical protein
VLLQRIFRPNHDAFQISPQEVTVLHKVQKLPAVVGCSVYYSSKDHATDERRKSNSNKSVGLEAHNSLVKLKIRNDYPISNSGERLGRQLNKPYH